MRCARPRPRRRNHYSRKAIAATSVRRLRLQHHALVQFDNADSWVQLTADAERRSLQELQPELLLPLSLNDKILGIISLGSKQS
jgi:hypothetical protein